MKILISSHAFAPSIGGIETVSRLLAAEFCKRGHDIIVVTQSDSPTDGNFPYGVVRKPGVWRMFGLAKWCDLYWQNNLSLRTLWPVLLMRKPVVITHQGSYCRSPKGLDLVQRIKHAVVNRLPSIAISRYVAGCFTVRSTVIPNPYDATVYHRVSGEVRDGIVFVGRLVAEKGVDILLEALARLLPAGARGRLTVIGTGPEQSRLVDLARQLRIDDWVTFVGARQPEEIAAVLSRQRVMVVPSRYDEPFGVVALEGLAAGCVVIGSEGGGLGEAINGCGVTFPNGDVDALAAALNKVLSDPGEADKLLVNVPQHLARFHPRNVAEAYLQVFHQQMSR